MSIGLVLAAVVAGCTPAAENPEDLNPAARGFFESLQARDYQGAMNRVAPDAIYAKGDEDSETTVEELVRQLDGSDNVSRIEVVELSGIPGVVVVKSRVVWPEDQDVDDQISVLSFEGGCIAYVRNYS